MAIKGIIFDLDGVIVFTDQLHYLAWKKIADQLGIYFDENINNRLRGVGRMDSLEIILENYEGNPMSQKEKEALAEEKNAYYRKLLGMLSPSDVSDAVRSTLNSLKNSGYQLAIGSSSKNARLILEKVELLEAFDAIADGNNIAKSKPDPEVFVKAAQLLGLQPQDCVVVEDAFTGIEAAKAGNITAIGIGDAAACDKADLVLESFEDLIDQIKKVSGN